MPQKRYLGDAVYVDHDGYSLILTTEDGFSATNTISLEPKVWQNLDEYVRETIEEQHAAKLP